MLTGRELQEQEIDYDKAIEDVLSRMENRYLESCYDDLNKLSDTEYKLISMSPSKEKDIFIERFTALRKDLAKQCLNKPSVSKELEIVGICDDLIELRRVLVSNSAETIGFTLDTLANKYAQFPNSSLGKAMLVVVVAAAAAVLSAIAGALVGAALTSWSGPGAALGAFLGALKGMVLGWEAGVAAGAAVFGVSAGVLTEVGVFGSNRSQMNLTIQAAQTLHNHNTKLSVLRK